MFKADNLTEGSVLKAVVALSIPTVASSLLQSSFNLIDMFFVGKLGPVSLAAVTMSGIIVHLLITVAIGISIGTLSLVSRFYGSRHFHAAGRVTAQAFYLSIFCSVFFGLGGWLLSRPLLRLLGARGEVLALAVGYFRIISSGAWTIFIFVVFSSALRGAGEAWKPFRVMALGVICNVILDPLLIFGLAGFPRLGVQGSAYATVISRMLTTVVIILVARAPASPLPLAGVFGRIRPRIIFRIVRIGFFSSVEMLIRSIAMLVLIRIVSPFGTAALAAFGIGFRIRAMILMPGVGMGYASGILVGQNLGAGAPRRARRTAWICWKIYEFVLIPVTASLLIFPVPVIRFFNSNPEVVARGSEFLSYLAVSFLFLSFNLVLGKSLQGAGDTAGPMVITALSLIFIGLPLAYGASLLYGVEGVWMAILASTAINGLLVTAWFQRGGWTRLRHMERAFDDIAPEGI